MKKFISCLLLGSCLVAPAIAETLKFPGDKSFASITFPEGWEVLVNGDTIAAKSGDGSALIDVIVTRPDMLGPSNDKAWAILKVKPDWDSFKENKSTINGMNANVATVDAKESGGTTVKLILTSLEVTKDKGLMFIQRGEGIAANQDAITGILNSVTATP